MEEEEDGNGKGGERRKCRRRERVEKMMGRKGKRKK